MNTDDWRPLRDARRSPGVGVGVAARGGADVDSLQDRMEEATARLYRSILADIERMVTNERMHRLILVGQAPALSVIQGAMSKGLQDRVGEYAADAYQPGRRRTRVAAAGTGPHSGDEAEVGVGAARQGARRRRVGVHDTLTMIQDDRVHTLMVPWSDAPNVWLTAIGRVAATLEEVEALRPGGSVAEVHLMEVLTDLVQASGTILEFAEDGTEERLNAEFGGMAGLTRW